MAKRFEQVDASQKDEEGVQEAVNKTLIGDQEIVTTTYGRVVTHDDLDPSITEGVHTIKFNIPCFENVEYETDEENEDGSKKIGIREELVLLPRRIDLGKASIAAFREALKKFEEASEEAPVEAPKPKRGRPKKAAS